MKEYILEYNWDDGKEKICEFIDKNELNVSEYLQIFYDAGGYLFLIESMDKKKLIEKDLLNDEDIEFLQIIYRKIVSLSDNKSEEKIRIDYELNKVQRYKILKANPCIRSIFTNFESRQSSKSINGKNKKE